MATYGEVLMATDTRDAHAWRRQARHTHAVDARISRARLDGGPASQRASGAGRATLGAPSVPAVDASNGVDDFGRLGRLHQVRGVYVWTSMSGRL